MKKIVNIHQLKHGDSVRCRIDGINIDDAKISIEEYSDQKRVYICQNFKNGESCSDRQGYRFSWIIYYTGGRFNGAGDPVKCFDSFDVHDLVVIDGDMSFGY